jgi:hypothetical protein
VAVLALLLPAGRALGGQFALSATDRVLFFGSTAMWPASFGMQVETFVGVKYPELKTRFWHWGPALPASLAEMKKRLGDYLDAFKPTVVVLNCGLADAENKPLVEAKLSEFRADLVAVLDQCQEAGAKVILVTPNCPEIHRKTMLLKVKYDEVVGHYAQAMRDLGAERKLTVVDWYAATHQRVLDAGGTNDKADALTSNGLYPTPLAHAIAAGVMLEALEAEPHQVTVHLDWVSLEARTTAGSVTAARRSESVVALELKGFPMPWPPPGIKRTLRLNHPASRYCRFVFHVHNAPPGGVLISAPGGKATPWLEQMLKKGFDMAWVGPLLAAPPVRELLDLITNRKNRRLIGYDRFLAEPFAEPEYAEVNAKYREVMAAELEATARVIDRTPRTMDVTLEIKLAKPAAPR